jgi:hypothetical protein
MSSVLTVEQAIQLIQVALVDLFGVASSNVIRANTDNARPAGSHFWLRPEGVISLGKPQKGRTSNTLEVLVEQQFAVEAIGNTAKGLMIRAERLLLRDDIIPLELVASGVSVRRLDETVEMDETLSNTIEPRSRRTFYVSYVINMANQNAVETTAITVTLDDTNGIEYSETYPIPPE